MAYYFVRSFAALLLFYLGYRIIFERDSFLVRNRIYLMLSLVFSFLLPLFPQPFSLPYFNSVGLKAEAGIPFQMTSAPGLMVTAGNESSSLPEFSLELGLLIIYLTGAGFMLIRFFSELLAAFRLIRRSERIICQGQTIFVHEGGLSHFSFFHRIMLNKAFLKSDPGDLWRVIAHEKAHIRQAHGFDLLLTEMALILQWFNPLVWLYRRSLVEVHEYLADKEVLKNGCPRGVYQAVLVNQSLGIQVFRTSHSFSHVNLKKRIQMMTKIKSSRIAHMKALFIVPLFLLALIIACRGNAQTLGEAEKKFTGKVFDQATGAPIDGAHVIVKGTTVGTKTSGDGSFSLLIPDGSELQISYVGYSTLTLAASGNEPLKAGLVMRNIDLNNQSIGDSKVNVTEEKIVSGGEVFTAVETMPAFPGGNEGFRTFINDQLKYPEAALRNGITGEVLISFTVNEAGKVEGIKVEKGVSPELDAEAVRVVGLSPAWIPGTNGGKKVKVNFVVPIRFNLPDDVFFIVEDMPMFENGKPESFSAYIEKQLKYPEEAKRDRIQGKVIVSFVIDANGKLTKANVERSAGPLLDAEALRVVRESPDWTPGKQRGKNVAVQFTFPIVFSLGEK